MYRKDETIIFLMLEIIDKIISFSSEFKSANEFEADVKSFDATMMNFVALGETVSKLSDKFKEKYNHIDWQKIYAFRNIIAHDYFGIYAPEVWEIINTHIPKLKSELENIK